MPNSKYVDVLLAVDAVGTFFVVSAPACSTEVGGVVLVCSTMAKVVKRACMDTQRDDYAILAAATTIHKAEAFYSLKWENGEGNTNADTESQ